MLSTISPSALALSFLLLPSSARVIWVPGYFEPPEEAGILGTRDTAVCGGDSSLTPCGSAMPSDFCCSSGLTCLALNTSASVTAAICCPQGQDCTLINPVSCDIGAQNLTATQFHSSPPQQLDKCGDACCPLDYDCQNGQCVARTAPTPASQTAPTSTESSTSTGTSKASGTSATAIPGNTPLGDPNATHSDDDFSGASFAAGFIPGLAIGAILAALIIFLILKKKRSNSDSYVDEKKHNRDTLTDLGTMDRRPYMHGRSISEPQADPSVGHRTDFLRYTPPRNGEPDVSGYVVNVRSPASGPVTPTDSPPKIKALFSRSPFMNQTPSTPVPTQPAVPAHMKRGTLSFKISPVRALKKQKSTHSLRRHMTEASQPNRTSSRLRPHPELNRAASTETIQVLMPSNEPYTPDRSAQNSDANNTTFLGSATYQPPKSSTSTWNSSSTSSADTPNIRQQAGAQTTYASSSRYPSEVQPLHTTPTRPPVPRLPNNTANAEPFGFLGSPYTPTKEAGASKATKGGLAPPGKDNRRDTTFSAMMERAGLRKSDLLMGPRPKK